LCFSRDFLSKSFFSVALFKLFLNKRCCLLSLRMSDDVPSVKREGTMQKTAREAKDFGYGCDCDDEEHDHDAEGDEANGGDKPPSKKRQSTMQATAQEGIEFLKRGENEDSDDNELDNESDDGEEEERDEVEEEEGEDHKGAKNGKKPNLKKKSHHGCNSR